ncbi:MAG TPA: polysaccharide biosynthesis/export family protein [Pyrinomonadaceae bacterium]|nr:polysaccharide biosynthesis/export family protein [Pyrinomonadaceae bacterium]
MKKRNRLTAPGLVAVVAIVMSLIATMSVAAQTQDEAQKARPRTTTAGQDKDKKKPVAGERLEPDDPARTPTDVSDEMQANRQEQISEEAAINPYYNNFFSTYRLGPEDIISVEVFNQDRYSRKGITIPPSGRVSLSLIPGGVFVNGKTVEQVAELIKQKYDEYIIDPQVTVSLDKASSYRYSVIGDVLQPGIRLMNHRMTVTEALAEAGGVLGTGDKSKVVVLRRQQDGMLATIPVNVSAIYKGKAADTTFLVPGDQIIVPGNKLKKIQQILGFANVLSFARVFGVPMP